MKEFNSRLLKGKDSTDNNENESWWQRNPMTYDWDKNLGELDCTEKYFDAVDRIFGEGHSLLGNPNWPKGKILDHFIPYQDFSDKKILEIGCGAGLVSSHIVSSGAELSAIDITEQAIEMTQERFKLKGQVADIRQMNAEKLSFEDNFFDYVVSWGVIHHSGNMKAIIDEIYRVLKPNGKAFIMIYNINSLRYQIYCRFWLGIMKLKLLSKSLEEIAGSITDGYIARHLNEEEFSLLSPKFAHKNYSYSDEKNTIMKYLFGIALPFKYSFFMTKGIEKFLAKRWGWYLQIVLTK